MSSTKRLVLPRLPTALATYAYVDLPGYDLWLHYVDSVHVLSAELDVSRFEEALSKALQVYPHAAGQLRCRDQRWSIELTNTAVPLDVDYKLDTNSDSLLDSDWVIQDNISPFLNYQPLDINLVNGDAPLLRLKLTFFRNETSIGVSWLHTLGDGIVMFRFMHTLSQFYQGLPPRYALPTFKKYHFPTPTARIAAEFWPRMSHLHDTCLFSELEEKFAESNKNVEHLRWRFETRDLAELRSALSLTYGPLSKQDCFTAYVVTALNGNRKPAVQKVTNASSYRQVSTSFVHEDMAGNQVQHVPVIIPVDMAGIATALRRALTECRKPDYVHGWVSVASNLMLEAANARKTFCPLPKENVVTVNSMTTIDWCSAHFGYPDGSRFHMTGAAKLWLRCFRSNPAKGADGVWRVRQSVDASMGVTADLKPKLLETLSRGIQYNLTP